MASSRFSWQSKKLRAQVKISSNTKTEAQKHLLTVITVFPSTTQPTTMSAPVMDPLGEIPMPTQPGVLP